MQLAENGLHLSVHDANMYRHARLVLKMQYSFYGRNPGQQTGQHPKTQKTAGFGMDFAEMYTNLYNMPICSEQIFGDIASLIQLYGRYGFSAGTVIF